MKPYVISRQMLEATMIEKGIPYVGFQFDARYAVMAESFITGRKLAKKLKEDRAAWKADVYAEGENDCDDFAFSTWEYIKGMHRMTPNRPTGTSPAWGVFLYIPIGKDKGHAISFAIAGVPHNLQVVFYEPQIQNVIQLTRKEITSCMLWLA
jgi:hypothetical protein